MNYVQVLKSWRNTDCKTGHTHKYITLPKDKNNAKHNMMKQKVERAKKKMVSSISPPLEKKYYLFPVNWPPALSKIISTPFYTLKSCYEQFLLL